MPNYVEEGYSENYVEGDSSSPTECDLTSVITELNLVKQQNIDLNTKLDTILSAIQSNNTLNLNINSKLVDISSNIEDIPTSQLDISNLVTEDYINSKVPFVDDMSIKIFPNGTKVDIDEIDGYCTVISSHYLPYEQFTYIVVYTVSYTLNGVDAVSNFPSPSVVRYIEPEVV